MRVAIFLRHLLLFHVQCCLRRAFVATVVEVFHLLIASAVKLNATFALEKTAQLNVLKANLHLHALSNNPTHQLQETQLWGVCVTSIFLGYPPRLPNQELTIKKSQTARVCSSTKLPYHPTYNKLFCTKMSSLNPALRLAKDTFIFELLNAIATAIWVAIISMSTKMWGFISSWTDSGTKTKRVKHMKRRRGARGGK